MIIFKMNFLIFFICALFICQLDQLSAAAAAGRSGDGVLQGTISGKPLIKAFTRQDFELTKTRLASLREREKHLTLFLGRGNKEGLEHSGDLYKDTVVVFNNIFLPTQDTSATAPPFILYPLANIPSLKIKFDMIQNDAATLYAFPLNDVWSILTHYLKVGGSYKIPKFMAMTDSKILIGSSGLELEAEQLKKFREDTTGAAPWIFLLYKKASAGGGSDGKSVYEIKKLVISGAREKEDSVFEKSLDAGYKVKVLISPYDGIVYEWYVGGDLESGWEGLLEEIGFKGADEEIAEVISTRFKKMTISGKEFYPWDTKEYSEPGVPEGSILFEDFQG